MLDRKNLEHVRRRLKIMRSLANGARVQWTLLAAGAKKAGRLNLAASAEGHAAGHHWCVNEIQQLLDVVEERLCHV